MSATGGVDQRHLFPSGDQRWSPATDGSSADQHDRVCRAALSRLGEPGDLRLAQLVADVGAAEAWTLLVAQDVRVPTTNRTSVDAGTVAGARDDVELRARDVDPTRELDQAARHGIRFVVPGDPEWPPRLDDLGRAGSVQRRGGPPLGLWVRGRPLPELLATSVALVGSRSATTYGTTAAADLAAHAAALGVGVVSGAAFGIDQAAHRAALAVDGPTVAVLACGVDRPYPLAHADLLSRIGASGAVVSELPPGCAPTRVRFLARNRLIAALSDATVVVEAAVRSGALNTAHWAGRLHRPLMGVPGPITSAASAGVHELVRSRDALLVTSGEQVVETIGGPGAALGVPRGAETVRDQLPRLLREVLEGVPRARPATTAAVATEVGLAVHRVADALGDLADRGLVEGLDGGWRQATGPRGDPDAPVVGPTVGW